MVWYTWTSEYTSPTTSTAWDSWNYSTSAVSTTDATWNNWSSGYSVNTSTGNEVWYVWTSDSTGTTNDYKIKVETKKTENVVYFPVYTTEQRRAIETQKKINSIWSKIKQEEVEEERKAARRRANLLLLDILGSKRFRQFRKTGRVFVKGEKYDWLITRQGKVSRIEKDKVVDLCVHMKNKWSYIEEDAILALVLAAKLDDSNLSSTGNNIREYKKEDIEEGINSAANF